MIWKRMALQRPKLIVSSIYTFSTVLFFINSCELLLLYILLSLDALIFCFFFFGRHKIAFYSYSLTLVAALYYFIKYQLANAFKTNSFF